MAGATATILTQPADVLRCHLQIDHRQSFNVSILNLFFVKHLFNYRFLLAIFILNFDYRGGFANFKAHIVERGLIRKRLK